MESQILPLTDDQWPGVQREAMVDVVVSMPAVREGSRRMARGGTWYQMQPGSP